MTKRQSEEIARSMRKGYMKLLSQQARKAAQSIDSFFFMEGDQESEGAALLLWLHLVRFNGITIYSSDMPVILKKEGEIHAESNATHTKNSGTRK